MLLSVTLLARIRSSAMQGILLNVLYKIHSPQTNSESEQKERRSNPWYIKHTSLSFAPFIRTKMKTEDKECYPPLI